MPSHNIESSTTYDIKKQKGQLQSFMTSSRSAKPFQVTLRVPELTQLYKMFRNWFTAMCPKGT
jgi:NADH:ubiquinone oxidoreductase subunit D